MERFRKVGTQVGAHEQGIWTIGALQGGEQGHFATGGCDGKVKTWSLKSEKEMSASEEGPLSHLGTYSGHTLPVLDMAIVQGGRLAVTTGMDGYLKKWDFAGENEKTGRSIQQVSVTEMWCVDVTNDGKTAVTGGASGAVKFVDMDHFVVDETYIVQTDAENRREPPMILSIALSADRTKFVAGTNDGSVTVLDTETGKPIGGRLARHGGPVRSIGFMEAEPYSVISGSDDQLVNLYDIRSSNLTGALRGHKGMVFCATSSMNGNFVVSGSSDCSVRIWDRMTKDTVFTYKGHKAPVWSAKYSSDGNFIAVVSDDGCVSVLDSSNAETVV